jgi:hypothetical protein
MSKDGFTGFAERIREKAEDKQAGGQFAVEFSRILIQDFSYSEFFLGSESSYMAHYGSLGVQFSVERGGDTRMIRWPDGTFFKSPELSAIVHYKRSEAPDGNLLICNRIVFSSDNPQPKYPLTREELALFGRVENPDQPSMF